ncbi:transcriptional regulator [Azotosporobacter soli]|uniref:transcriptional regulator n=1 Tax=Azotosporobacter soli TaxID=3055040 RepID=UPI0031FF31C1
MLLRIGDKIVNRNKIYQLVDDMLDMRRQGFSQQEAANSLGIDRSLVSKLETVGEVRKGARLALVGFPIENCQELRQISEEEGVDFVLLMSEKERWNFLQSKSGVELFNGLMEIMATLRKYDIIIMLGSNLRIKLMETLLDKAVIGLQIGESPIEDDRYVDPERLRSLIRELVV